MLLSKCRPHNSHAIRDFLQSGFWFYSGIWTSFMKYLETSIIKNFISELCPTFIPMLLHNHWSQREQQRRKTSVHKQWNLTTLIFHIPDWWGFGQFGLSVKRKQLETRRPLDFAPSANTEHWQMERTWDSSLIHRCHSLDGQPRGCLWTASWSTPFPCSLHYWEGWKEGDEWGSMCHSREADQRKVSLRQE